MLTESLAAVWGMPIPTMVGIVVQRTAEDFRPAAGIVCDTLAAQLRQFVRPWNSNVRSPTVLWCSGEHDVGTLVRVVLDNKQGHESPSIHEHALHDLLVAVYGRTNMLVLRSQERRQVPRQH